MDHDGKSARRAELAAFLRARRARLRPADVGLPQDVSPGRRRTPGLRREEVAELSGVGLTWYTWLEQGRDISASSQVIDALARALLLDPHSHRHLRDLAGLATPSSETAGEDVLPRLRRLVDAAAPNLACVYDPCFDFLVWNGPYAHVRQDPGLFPRDRRNLVWMMFTDTEIAGRLVRWEPAARAVVAQFRAAVGRRPDDPRLAHIVAELSETSPKFREWWTEYTIRPFVPATIGVDHPEAGLIRLELFQFRPVEHPGLLMVLQVPAGAVDRERVASLLDGDAEGA
ncbi:helix-turn-helix transcriptional regulator [Actinomadura sp. 6N118]|uniref:helix-turn-helix transcriptional regulator n=1 Tax=Actinomadura sp. 6N118 TaxID=3375151 RepID=UPI0037A48099